MPLTVPMTMYLYLPLIVLIAVAFLWWKHQEQKAWDAADAVSKRSLLDRAPKGAPGGPLEAHWKKRAAELKDQEKLEADALECQRLGVTVDDLPRALAAERASNRGIRIRTEDTAENILLKMELLDQLEATELRDRLCADLPRKELVSWA